MVGVVVDVPVGVSWFVVHCSEETGAFSVDQYIQEGDAALSLHFFGELYVGVLVVDVVVERLKFSFSMRPDDERVIHVPHPHLRRLVVEGCPLCGLSVVRTVGVVLRTVVGVGDVASGRCSPCFRIPSVLSILWTRY